MPRYTRRTRTRSDDDYYYEPAPLNHQYLTVSDHEPVFTGVLDHDGSEIWREPNPMGFGKDEEW